MKNTFDNIFLDYGFVSKRNAYGVRLYYNKNKDYYASIDDKARLVMIFVDDDMVVRGRDYEGYSVQEVIDFLKSKGFKKEYSNGGGLEEDNLNPVDLFEDYEKIPDRVQVVLDTYQDAFENGDYKQLAIANRKLERIGYTFDYGLDGQAYNLRKLNDDEMKMKNGGLMKKWDEEEYRDGGSISSDRRFTEWDFNKLMASDKFEAVWSGNLWEINEAGRTRVLGKFNPKTKSLYISGDKNMNNFLVVWMTENGFVDADEYAILANGGGVGNDWFWNHAYRHYMRDASLEQRNKVKEHFIKEGLELDGESPRHAYIVVSVVNPEELKYFSKVGDNSILFDNGGGVEDGSYERSLVLRAITGNEDFDTEFINLNSKHSYLIKSKYIGNRNEDFIYIKRKYIDDLSVEFKIKVEFDSDEDGVRALENEIIEVEGVEIDIDSFTKDEQKKINDFMSNMKDHLYYRDDYANGGGVDDYDTRWAEMEAYSPYASRTEYENKKEYEGLDFASKTFAKSSEMLVRENLNNGEICMCKLKKILGHEPNYPIQIVGSLKLEKCFMKRFYKLA